MVIENFKHIANVFNNFVTTVGSKLVEKFLGNNQFVCNDIITRENCKSGAIDQEK